MVFSDPKKVFSGIQVHRRIQTAYRSTRRLRCAHAQSHQQQVSNTGIWTAHLLRHCRRFRKPRVRRYKPVRFGSLQQRTRHARIRVALQKRKEQRRLRLPRSCAHGEHAFVGGQYFYCLIFFWRSASALDFSQQQPAQRNSKIESGRPVLHYSTIMLFFRPFPTTILHSDPCTTQEEHAQVFSAAALLHRIFGLRTMHSSKGAANVHSESSMSVERHFCSTSSQPCMTAMCNAVLPSAWSLH